MKRFEFRLEQVRRWRSEQLHLEELKLRQALAELEAWIAAKQRVQEELKSTERELLSHASIEGLELKSLESFRRHVKARVRECENFERQSEAKMIVQRARVLEARRQFELLDQLREKALAKWRSEAGREQETLAAELFLSRATRNQ